MRQWILAFRPKTLTAALVPIIAATSLAYALLFPLQMWISWLALLSSIFIQIGTNLVNDAVDFKKGADTDTRIGPRRVTQAGVFSAKKVMAVGSLFFFAALLCGIPLVLVGGTPILLIGAASILCGYAYTAGPFPLAYKGLGDLFVILFFGLIAVGGLFYLLTGIYSMEALVLGFQIGFHCTVLIAVNNLRDVHTDRLAHKKTLSVRFGIPFARYEIAFLCLAPFALNLFWWHLGIWKAAALPLLCLPLAAKIIKLVFKTEPSPEYNKFLVKAATLQLLFGVLISVGFLL